MTYMLEEISCSRKCRICLDKKRSQTRNLESYRSLWRLSWEFMARWCDTLLLTQVGAECHDSVPNMMRPECRVFPMLEILKSRAYNPRTRF